MTIDSNDDGWKRNTRVPRPVFVALSTTSRTTVYTADPKNGQDVADSIYVANTHTAPVAVTIEYFENKTSTHFALLGEGLIPEHSTMQMELGWRMKKDDAIKVTAASANAIDVTFILSEIPSRST